MADLCSEKMEFEDLLAEEVSAVLNDPLFENAPVQRRLLQFLYNQTIASGGKISQFVVSVDGLGRPENVESLTDSYPRVQISRLRGTLERYYSRSQPAKGLCLYIRHGDYNLRLAERTKAYPGRKGALLSSPESASVNELTPHSRRDIGEPASAKADMATAQRPPRKLRWLFGAVGILIGTISASTLINSAENRAAIPANKAPQIALVDLSQEHDGSDGGKRVLEIVENVARHSFVVSIDQGRSKPAAYKMQIGKMQTRQRSRFVVLELLDAKGELLAREHVRLSDDDAASEYALEQSVANFVGPQGIIAQRVLREIGPKPRNDYECLIMVEGGRGMGVDVSSLLESCLTSYPESKYGAYWYGRKSFNLYKTEVANGGQPARDGEGWLALEKALAIDPKNPFANYLAAKVRVANRDCRGARPYLDRALTYGDFYPALTATIIVEGSLCAGALPTRLDAEAWIESAVEHDGAPLPLVRLYLFFAAAALERADLAHSINDTPSNIAGEGEFTHSFDLLREATSSPTAYRSHEQALDHLINGFYWGAGTRQGLQGSIARIAGAPREE